MPDHDISPQLLALVDHDAPRWEPKRLLRRLYIIPATLARGGTRLHLGNHQAGSI